MGKKKKKRKMKKGKKKERESIRCICMIGRNPAARLIQFLLSPLFENAITSVWIGRAPLDFERSENRATNSNPDGFFK